MQTGISTELTGAQSGTHKRAVRPGTVWPWIKEIPVGRNSDTERQEAPNPHWGMYWLWQSWPDRERPSTCGTDLRVGGGGRRPEGGYDCYGGSITVGYAGGSGTTSVTGFTTDVRPRTPHGIRDVTDTQARCPKPDSSLPFRLEFPVWRSTAAQLRPPPSGKLDIGWDLTLTGLHVIDLDPASSSPVISDLYSESSSTATHIHLSCHWRFCSIHSSGCCDLDRRPHQLPR